jgi:hypothetical protein
MINVIIVCYIMIRLGYGPPNWQTALNLIVPLTTLQDRLNDGRTWLDKKAPWSDKLLNRLHVPKPIMIIDTSPIEEEEEEPEEEMLDEVVDEQSGNEQANELAYVQVEAILNELEPYKAETNSIPAESVPPPQTAEALVG